MYNNTSVVINRLPWGVGGDTNTMPKYESGGTGGRFRRLNTTTKPALHCPKLLYDTRGLYECAIRPRPKCSRELS